MIKKITVSALMLISTLFHSAWTMDRATNESKEKISLQKISKKIFPLQDLPAALLPVVASQLISPGTITNIGHELDDIESLRLTSHKFRKALPAAVIEKLFKERCAGYSIKSLLLNLLEMAPAGKSSRYYGLDMKSFVTRDQLKVVNKTLMSLCLTHPCRNVCRAYRESDSLLFFGRPHNHVELFTNFTSIDDTIKWIGSPISIGDNADFLNSMDIAGITQQARITLPNKLKGYENKFEYRVHSIAADHEGKRIFHGGTRFCKKTDNKKVYVAQVGGFCKVIKHEKKGQLSNINILITRAPKLLLYYETKSASRKRGDFIVHLAQFDIKDGSPDKNFGVQGKISKRLRSSLSWYHYCFAINRQGAIIIGRPDRKAVIALFDKEGNELPLATNDDSNNDTTNYLSDSQSSSSSSITSGTEGINPNANHLVGILDSN